MHFSWNQKYFLQVYYESTCFTNNFSNGRLTLYWTDTHQQQTAFENIVGKEEIARNEQFLLFPQCFLLNQKNCIPNCQYFWHHTSIFICCWIGRAQNWHVRYRINPVQNSWYFDNPTEEETFRLSGVSSPFQQYFSNIMTKVNTYMYFMAF